MSWLSSLVGILFIGHSLFGPTNPQMMSEVLKEHGVRVDAQIINGAPLSFNWENGASAQGLNARVALTTGAYDTVILTEAIPLANHLEFSDTIGTAQSYYDLALKHNPDARVFLQETWHDLRSGTGVRIDHDRHDDIPWLERIDQDLAAWQGVVDAVNAGRDPGAEPMRLIPAGQAMARLGQEIRTGTVPGMRRIEDVFHDTIHPNDLGFYFLTMVQYAAITGESPVGLPRRLKSEWGQPYTAPTPAQARRLQEIAQDAVSDFLASAPPAAEPAAQDPPSPDPAVSDPAPDAPPKAVPAPFPAVVPSGPVPMAIGLTSVNDWSVQQPFLDVFKTARPWIGHKPRQWGGVRHDDLAKAGYLDPDGWPLEIPPELGSVGTLILTDLPEAAVSTAGRYVLRFDGKGIVEVAGRATGVRYGPNRVEFDFTPGKGGVDIRIQRSGKDGDHVRNISVVKLDHLDAYDRGELFNPLWLDRVKVFDAFRFMDWMGTTNSQQSGWSDRPRLADYTWARKGVPAEVLMALLAQTGADGWFNMPHQADDDYIRRFASLVRDGLGTDQKAYVELSNEVWNWQFEQARWADEMAKARWGIADAWVQYYAVRAVEMAGIWTEVFGARTDAQLVRVIATQTGWKGLEEAILEAPLWTAEQAGRKPPARHFDAYAVTGYFGGALGRQDRRDMVGAWLAESRAAAEKEAQGRGLTGSALTDFVSDHRYDQAVAQAWAELRDGLSSGKPDDTLAYNLSDLLPYHAAVAERYGLDLIMYEGGSHVAGVGPMIEDEELTAFLIHLSFTAEMGELYRELIAGWHDLGGTLFNAFGDVYNPGRWGSWGQLRHLTDENPRWDALMSFR